MPAPEVAVNYYTGGDLYLFGKPFIFMTHVVYGWENQIFDTFQSHFPDEFQTSRVPNTRRPKIGML